MAAPTTRRHAMPDATQGKTLLEETQRLMRQTSQTYLDIYAATGLNPTWLSHIATGKIADPSVNKVQTLYEHLKGAPLLRA